MTNLVPGPPMSSSHIETPAESAAIVDQNLHSMGSAGLERGGEGADEVRRILDLLAVESLTYRHEDDLQAEISQILTVAGVQHVREARLGPGERIDLLTAAGVGIEVKIAGSWTAAVRQLLRYAHDDQIRALVLVSTQASHHNVPHELAGVPVAVYSLIGQGL